uniref:N-acetyltransferase domain-containing protein n=2 Tax=Meloidogyne incognita group TaxID=654580 RepID=A0A914LTF1_MELIC
MDNCKNCKTCSREVESSYIDIYPIKPPRRNSCNEDVLRQTMMLPDGRSVKVELYKGEDQMAEIMALMRRELSEPYSIYTYRYFIYCWPELCFLAIDSTNSVVGAIVGKLDQRQSEDINLPRSQAFKNVGIGTTLAKAIICAMTDRGCEEIVLETEASNNNSLSLYARLGFIRESRLFRYYMSGSDAFRLKLYLPESRKEVDEEPKNDTSVIAADLISTVCINDDLCEEEKTKES